MIKSISYWSFQNGLANTHPIPDALAEARKAGFEGVELCISTEGELSTSTTRKQCDVIRQQIADSGVIVQTLASGLSWGFNPTSEKASIRKKSIKLHADAIQRAAWIGLDAYLLVPGVVMSPISPDIVRYDLAVERAFEATSQLLEVAEKVGVDLCVENVWNGMFYSPLEFCDFIDSFKSKRLGAYFDVGNVLGYHQYPPHWIELLGKRIKRIHIKDYAMSLSKGTLVFCDLLKGQVPWPESIRALKKIGYDKTIVAEMMPWDKTLVKRTSKAMDKILGR